MNRREAFLAVGAGVTGLALPTQVAASDIGPKGYVVVNLFVGCLPPYKAEAFVERVKKQMVGVRHRLNIGDKWPIIVQPTRDSEHSGVEVFVIDKNENLQPVERLIYDTKRDRLLTVDRREQYADEELQHIHDYVHAMLGAPVVKMPDGLDEVIDFYIERGQRFNVTDLQRFVLASVQDCVYLTEDSVQDVYLTDGPVVKFLHLR